MTLYLYGCINPVTIVDDNAKFGLLLYSLQSQISSGRYLSRAQSKIKNPRIQNLISYFSFQPALTFFLRLLIGRYQVKEVIVFACGAPLVVAQ